ncbi:hypothetical protein CTI12_AA594890 [Artemisia annua]|uniref:Uncharacterized protein n=1 Tax=Artemisia annua TaxID=35608 RepID=A0A2U1KJF8_ARTAN|nr:hypothetical protein CTI12_AA594890 [Artemisia annua]
MVIFQNEVINNGNDEQILFVRRSGRLSNRQRPKRDNEHYETIDLTIDGDSEDEQGVLVAKDSCVVVEFDQSDNGVQVEGENVDNGVENPVSIEENQVKPDKRAEKVGPRRSANAKGDNKDNDLEADKETEQVASLKNDDGHKKNEVKRDKGTKKLEHERAGTGKDIGWEDDVFEDDGGDGVPEDAEAMKKKAASFLKRAGELIEMADKVTDKGIEDNPDDHGFFELKELRDQLFVPRKFSNGPDDNEDEEAYEQCFTPEKSVNKKGSGAADECVLPFTQVAIAMSDEVCRDWSRNHQQIPTRLNFEDDEGFDLNVTQPPATQGKVVVDDLEADKVLLESLRDYVSQDPADGGGFTTPDHPISVRAQESNTSNRLSRFGKESMGSKSKEIVPVYPNPLPLNALVPKLERARAQRKKLLPEVLRSPYMTREVSVVYGLETHEKKVAECFFSGRLQETDVVFKTPFVDGERVVLESLFSGIDVASGAIDLFTHVLNNAEKHRSKATVTRLFCHTSMLTSDMVNWDYHRALQKFVENMDYVVSRSEYETLDYVQLISLFEDYLLHKNNPNHDRMTHAEREVMQLGCRTTNNFVECGVFTMRHMETYKGGNRRTWRGPKRYIPMMLANKPTRMCGYCGKYSYHDARNCPERKKVIEGHDVYQVVFKDMDVYGNELLY